jgi:8-oxo-dGTP pyrophosphatase MutT (NUDIX family)
MDMNDNVWRPNVTVAAIVERDGRFLLVEEETDDGTRYNQPAGHWERNETLLDAVVRETQEESAYTVVPTALVGIYRWNQPGQQRTYLRFAFAAQALAHDPAQPLDTGIVRAAWLTPEEIRALAHRHRSPLLQACVDDYRAGRRFPLDLIQEFDSK